MRQNIQQSKIILQAEGIRKMYRTRLTETSVPAMLRSIWRPRYATQEALAGISLTMSPGECLGVLGPNGAGKSTLMKILTGLQKPSAGKVTVLGCDPFDKHHSFLLQIGAVFGHKNSLWWDLPLIESFETTKHIYQIADERYQSNLNELKIALNLSGLMHKSARVLSLGERVKAELAINLLHDPKVLFLDEPTVGLDVTSKSELRQYLRRCVKDKDMAIFLTSHDMGDVESCCDRVLLVDKGKLEFNGSVADLKHQMANQISLVFTGPDRPLSDDEVRIISDFASNNKQVIVDTQQLSVVVLTCPLEVRGSIMRSVVEACPDVMIETQRPSLEDILAAYFRRENN